VLTGLVLIPLAAMTSGYLWYLVPKRVRLRYQGWQPLAILVVVVCLAVWAAGKLGSPVESLVFGGDFKGWLDGHVGTATPGLAILVWPLMLGVAWLGQRFLLGRWTERRERRFRPAATALVELAKFLLVLAAGTTLAWLAGVLLMRAGFDVRHGLVGTYVQRNTLVVGFVMGFAVIPIIYTLSEDALASVPEHLRTASLACGATPWQTAVRVIMPVAMSGIFSAAMIGLGRAVGETMIVVMAAGNTPVMELNLFNGLRALSANIVVELPEAVKDSTLYRMLFLAALTLFVVTFLVNTLAEIVRMRFRKRAFQL
jgi:phosphate transport system permease protein